MDSRGIASSQPQANQGTAPPRERETPDVRKHLLSAGLRTAAWAAPGLVRMGLVRKSLDDNAGVATADPDYREGMIGYNRAVADLLDPIWRQWYMDPDHKIPQKGGS